MSKPKSAAEWNQINRAFWQEEKLKMTRLEGDKEVWDLALQRLREEQLRQVPVAQQSTLEHELAGADHFRREVLSERAARGGRADKRDALQRLINAIVSKNPRIDSATLLSLLRDQTPGETIVEIRDDENEIEFKTGAGDGVKSAKISGLKHRLSRARTKLQSQ